MCAHRLLNLTVQSPGERGATSPVRRLNSLSCVSCPRLPRSIPCFLCLAAVCVFTTNTDKTCHGCKTCAVRRTKVPRPSLWSSCKITISPWLSWLYVCLSCTLVHPHECLTHQKCLWSGRTNVHFFERNYLSPR